MMTMEMPMPADDAHDEDVAGGASGYGCKDSGSDDTHGDEAENDNDDDDDDEDDDDD